MSEYGVKPPVAMFGLIKVRDQVTVRFDARVALPGMAKLAQARPVVIVLRAAEGVVSAPPALRASGS